MMPAPSDSASSAGCPSAAPASAAPASAARAAVSQPSSCQRTRSAVASSLNASRVRQIRSSACPRLNSARIFNRRHTTPAAASFSCNFAANWRAAKAAESTRAIGSAGITATDRSLRASSGATFRSARAVTMSCTRAPGGPKRLTTWRRGKFATSPNLRRPSC